MITFRNLSVHEGHGEIYVNDSNGDERRKLAEDVLELVRRGHSVFLMDGNKVTGRIQSYDPDKNEWLLAGSSIPKREESVQADLSPTETPNPKRVSWWHRFASKKSQTRVPAEDTKVVAIPQRAGG